MSLHIVTKETMEEYLKIQKEGREYDNHLVRQQLGITKEEHQYIVKNYGKLLDYFDLDYPEG